MKRLLKLPWLFSMIAFSVISMCAQEEPPKVLKYEKPRSLGAAIVTGTQGDVVLDLVIEADGKVVSAEPRSGHAILIGLSKTAAQSWLFSKAFKPERKAVIHFVYRISYNNDLKNNFRDPTIKYHFRRPNTLNIDITAYPRELHHK